MKTLKELHQERFDMNKKRRELLDSLQDYDYDIIKLDEQIDYLERDFKEEIISKIWDFEIETLVDFINNSMWNSVTDRTNWVICIKKIEAGVSLWWGMWSLELKPCLNIPDKPLEFYNRKDLSRLADKLRYIHKTIN